ncbi:uricase [Dacryopinax primogenitus]|uniref:Uricase n=1 Tax=Dacryopinax primogenitus (strain DJM 731) TaxID=1858805 RepID=M5G7Q2_DACPD|nr:uricase [Dacryopinax primogenitus]EJU04774.1 uricase [Dacryopinax primogenitus]
MAELTAARYGKDKVRIFRVVRSVKGDPQAWHDVVEYNVKALLEGDIAASYTKADNSVVVATDSIKNTCNVFAKTSPHVLHPEQFALDLGVHFVTTYAHIHKAFIDIEQLKWSRITVSKDGQPHRHSFVRDGDEKRLTSVEVDATKGKNAITAKVTSGLSGLLVLKSGGSAFEGFVRDEWTTLVEVDDRIFSTEVDLSYTFALPVEALTAAGIAALQDKVGFDKASESAKQITLDLFATDESASVQATLFKMCSEIIAASPSVESVSYRLPNKHYIPVDLGFKGLANLKPVDAEVFCPVAAPSGLITATVSRKH